MEKLHVRGRMLPSGEQRDLWVVGGRITFEEQRGARTLRAEGWLTPGLADAHAHLAMASPAEGSPARERVRASARAHLDAGVLLVREPGSLDHASVGLGPHEGLPRVVTAGRFLAPPGGYIPGLAREVDPEHLPAAVREEARASGAWVKLIGDFISDAGRIEPNWEPDALRGAARAAHEAGARITVHATHPVAIAAAIEAGFDAVEHATGLRAEHIAGMRERGMALVPTLTIGDLILPFFERSLDARGVAEVRAWLAAHPGNVAAAAKAGVPVLAGTDAGMVPHGQVGHEVGLLRKAGLPAEHALGAASWDARRYLGFPGLDEGAPADIAVFEDDPRTPHGLGKPALVVLDGEVVGKRPVAR